MNDPKLQPDSIPVTTANWNETFKAKPDEWFFGKEPSEMARLTFSYWKQLHGESRGTLLDHGCGEGRDSVFMTKNGFHVTAVDGAQTAIEKTKRLAAEQSIEIAAVFNMDVPDYTSIEPFDIVFSHNCIQFLGAGALSELARLKQMCLPLGLLSVSAFTREAEALANRNDLYRFDQNELKFHFRDWRILYYGEFMLWREPTQNYLSFAHVVAQNLSVTNTGDPRND